MTGPAAGATPAAPDATSGSGAQAPAAPANGTQAPAPAADGDDLPAGLGDAGKRAIQAERDARREAERLRLEAERERDELRTKHQTAEEKALEAARKEGATGERVRTDAIVRRAEVKAALGAAGLMPSVLDMAIHAEDFAALKVSDDGQVQGLEAAVAKFKANRADLFRSGGTTDFGQGPRPPAATGQNMDDIIRRQAGR